MHHTDGSPVLEGLRGTGGGILGRAKFLMRRDSGRGGGTGLLGLLSALSDEEDSAELFAFNLGLGTRGGRLAVGLRATLGLPGSEDADVGSFGRGGLSAAPGGLKGPLGSFMGAGAGFTGAGVGFTGAEVG